MEQLQQLASMTEELDRTVGLHDEDVSAVHGFGFGASALAFGDDERPLF